MSGRKNNRNELTYRTDLHAILPVFTHLLTLQEKLSNMEVSMNNMATALNQLSTRQQTVTMELTAKLNTQSVRIEELERLVASKLEEEGEPASSTTEKKGFDT